MFNFKGWKTSTKLNRVKKVTNVQMRNKRILEILISQLQRLTQLENEKNVTEWKWNGDRACWRYRYEKSVELKIIWSYPIFWVAWNMFIKMFVMKNLMVEKVSLVQKKQVVDFIEIDRIKFITPEHSIAPSSRASQFFGCLCTEKSRKFILVP